MFQGLMASLEPRLDERSISHSHSFTEKKHQDQEKIPKSETKSEGDNLGGWSFIQDKKQRNGTEQIYVHPLVKKSSLALSAKSLEMCTEGLGSETGCNIVENIDELFDKLNKNHVFHISKLPKIVRKVNRTVKFPPPLNSIIGSNGLKISPCREDGRLVLKAISIPSTILHFQAERYDGKLRISFFKDEVNVADEEEVEESYDNNGDDNDMDIVGDTQMESRCKGENKKQDGNENVGWLFHENTCLLELRLY